MIHLDAFFPLTLIFALFPWTNVMQLSKQSLVRWRRFHGYHCPDRNTHLKNGGSFKKYSKFTPIIHINPNSYSFRITFVMIIIVRFFYHLLHQLIKIWKSGHKLRQGHKLVRLPYYLFLFSLYNFTFCTGIFELFVGDFPGKWQYLRQLTESSDLKHQQLIRKWGNRERNLFNSIMKIRCLKNTRAYPELWGNAEAFAAAAHPPFFSIYRNPPESVTSIIHNAFHRHTRTVRQM